MVVWKVDKGVILAAGDGDRLEPLTCTCPKVLLPLSKKEPLITHPIQALASAGIKDIAIVVGYLGDMVIQSLGDGSRFGVKLKYVPNRNYLSGNAISVLETKEWAQRAPVVLCMGDHLIEKKLVRYLLHNHTFNDTLCVDYTPAPHHQIDEATKVAVDITGCIRDIGKELARWDALDTGVFLLTDDFFQAIDELAQYRGTGIETADVIRFLVDEGHHFHTCDVSGYFWMDVDTEEDLNLARLL